MKTVTYNGVELLRVPREEEPVKCANCYFQSSDGAGCNNQAYVERRYGDPLICLGETGAMSAYVVFMRKEDYVLYKLTGEKP